MSGFNAQGYGNTIARWLEHRPLVSLGHGEAGLVLKGQRSDVTVSKAFAPGTIKNIDMANAMLAGLWLAHNDLEASHQISRTIGTPTGSYWHGIMHRREGDFSNAKHWFRQVGGHPIDAALRKDAAELSRNSPHHPTMLFLEGQTQWDAFAFADFVDKCVHGRSPCGELARAVQQREWELLFDFCYRAAITR